MKYERKGGKINELIRRRQKRHDEIRVITKETKKIRRNTNEYEGDKIWWRKTNEYEGDKKDTTKYEWIQKRRKKIRQNTNEYEGALHRGPRGPGQMKTWSW